MAPVGTAEPARIDDREFLVLPWREGFVKFELESGPNSDEQVSRRVEVSADGFDWEPIPSGVPERIRPYELFSTGDRLAGIVNTRLEVDGGDLRSTFVTTTDLTHWETTEFELPTTGIAELDEFEGEIGFFGLDVTSSGWPVEVVAPCGGIDVAALFGAQGAIMTSAWDGEAVVRQKLGDRSSTGEWFFRLPPDLVVEVSRDAVTWHDTIALPDPMVTQARFATPDSVAILVGDGAEESRVLELDTTTYRWVDAGLRLSPDVVHGSGRHVVDAHLYGGPGNDGPWSVLAKTELGWLDAEIPMTQTQLDAAVRVSSVAVNGGRVLVALTDATTLVLGD